METISQQNKLFRFSILSQEATVFDAEVLSVILPSVMGYLGILVGHAPLAAQTLSGKIIVKELSGKTVVLTSQMNGLLEIRDNRVTLLF
jgi:F0F1-type ATP synthase epsilon subunit